MYSTCFSLKPIALTFYLKFIIIVKHQMEFLTNCYTCSKVKRDVLTLSCVIANLSSNPGMYK